MHKGLALRVLVALAVGIIEPYAEVAWKCRAGVETSEACVWARAYLPLSRVVALIVIAPVCFVVLEGVARLARRSSSAAARKHE